MSKQNYFNIILTIISLTTISFVSLNVTPFSITGETFIGIIAAFIGIIVTLHIGFQIIKYLEIREELKEIKTNREEILDTRNRIAISENKSQEIYYTLLAISMSDNMKCVERFLTQLEALKYALRTDRKDYADIYIKLKEYINKIQPGYGIYTPSIELRDRCLGDYFSKVKKIESQIKASANYAFIKYEYKKIMDSFNTRLENATNNETVNTEESNKIMG